jgi:subtilisin family serine protease
MNASSAYAAGGTGAGITVAVIDTNVDTTISELQGQLAAGGRDINAATRTASDIDTDGHGTMVTSTIVGLKNGAGVHGIAFEAKVLAIRADRPGSCQETGTDEGCRFRDADVAAGIDYAIAQGARVINLSLGGEIDTDPSLENAIRRAATAGVLVVISAGNEGAPASGTTPAEGLSPTEPAYIAGETASRGLVVAVGAYDSNATLSGGGGTNPNFRKIAGFSNRAGQTQNFYILAPGVRLVTAGVDDDVRLPGGAGNDTNSDGNYWSASGTSFASPLVAGALALLLDAFPNITPANALRALLISADDYVDPTLDPVRGEAAGAGVDAVSGVGIINLARAFSPIGLSSFRFDGEDVPLAQALAPAGGALGDWAEASGAFDGLVFQDSLERGFRVGEAQLSASRSVISDMRTRAEFARAQGHAVDLGGVASFSWFAPVAPTYDPRTPWAEAPEPMFTATMRLNDTTIATGRGGGPERMTPVMTLIDDPSGPASLETGGRWSQVQQAFGPVTLDFRASDSFSRSASGAGFTFASPLGSSRIGWSSMDDRATTLGGALQSRFGGADGVRFSAVSLENVRDIAGWRLSAAMEAASARLDGVDVSNLWTSSWSFSAAHPLAGGAVRFTLAQPRRAEGGEISFLGPVAVLKSGALVYEQRTASLTPSGREVDFETAWSRQLGPRTSFEAAAALSTSPNHVAGAETEAAVWLSLRHAW